MHGGNPALKGLTAQLLGLKNSTSSSIVRDPISGIKWDSNRVRCPMSFSGLCMSAYMHHTHQNHLCIERPLCHNLIKVLRLYQNKMDKSPVGLKKREHRKCSNYGRRPLCDWIS